MYGQQSSSPRQFADFAWWLCLILKKHKNCCLTSTLPPITLHDDCHAVAVLSVTTAPPHSRPTVLWALLKGANAHPRLLHALALRLSAPPWLQRFCHTHSLSFSHALSEPPHTGCCWWQTAPFRPHQLVADSGLLSVAIIFHHML